MEFGEESSPALAFEKDALELTVEDVYDISYVIGRDLLKISSRGEEVSDLQFRIVRVLEMFETLVNKYNLSVEELKMERDNLKSELDRIVKESSSGEAPVTNSGTEPAGDRPDRPQQTALHHAGAEGSPAGEEPAEGSAHGGPGGAAAVQEWDSSTGGTSHGGSGPGVRRSHREQSDLDKRRERGEDDHQQTVFIQEKIRNKLFRRTDHRDAGRDHFILF